MKTAAMILTGIGVVAFGLGLAATAILVNGAMTKIILDETLSSREEKEEEPVKEEYSTEYEQKPEEVYTDTKGF